MKYITLVTMVSSILCACGGGGNSNQDPVTPPQPPGPDNTTYPDSSWQQVSPEEVGLTQSGIDAALSYAFHPDRKTQGVVIVRHGVIVGERYAEGKNADSLATSWSTGKSFASTLIGIAIDQGFISALDDSAVTYLPQWSNTERDEITVRAILEMRSGLRMASDNTADSEIYISGGINGDQLTYALQRVLESTPSTDNWQYQNTDSMLLSGILENATGQHVFNYADVNLFAKIGMQATWWTDEQGHVMTYCCIDTTSRDFARFGLLMVRDGSWHNQQVVSKSWVQQATQSAVTLSTQNHYGLHWWINPQDNYFYSAGRDRNNIYIFPQYDLVVVRNSLYSKMGSNTVRTGSNWHYTEAPNSWSDAQFLSYITDDIVN